MIIEYFLDDRDVVKCQASSPNAHAKTVHRESPDRLRRVRLVL